MGSRNCFSPFSPVILDSFPNKLYCYYKKKKKKKKKIYKYIKIYIERGRERARERERETIPKLHYTRLILHLSLNCCFQEKQLTKREAQ
jgi:hypothetical protein